MGLRHLLDEAVSPEEPELAADLGGQPTLLGLWRRACRRVKDLAEVSVSKAGGGELAACHGPKDRDVVRVTDAEGSEAVSAVDNGPRHGVEDERTRNMLEVLGHLVSVLAHGASPGPVWSRRRCACSVVRFAHQVNNTRVADHGLPRVVGETRGRGTDPFTGLIAAILAPLAIAA